MSTSPAASSKIETPILVVDDEPVLAGMAATYLERSGYSVVVTGDGAEAVRLAREQNPQVIILDLGLPGLDGIEVCRQVRTFSDCYIIMVTARADEVDTLIGLSVGADDYLVKPVSMRELLARVHTVLRRPRVAATHAEVSPPARVIGELRVDSQARQASMRGSEVELTRTEFDLLEVLSSRPRQAFSRRQLVDAVWGAEWVGDEHLVDVHIGHLRRKLGDSPQHPRYIRTIRGLGYRMGEGA